MNRCIPTLFFIILSFLGYSQDNSSQDVSNRFLVECHPQFDIEQWALNKSAEVKTIRPIFKKLDYWLVEYLPSTEKSISARLSELRGEKGIVNAYPDAYAQSRAVPNDPMYIDQWSKQLIEVEKVWDITTGGTTMDGQEIVVAVIDDGYDIEHEDLIDNIWLNTAETPDDGVDNDNNGYVDDYYGVHLPTQSDDHLVINHGVAVSGIIGSKGNNGIGLSGINWDIKMMLLSITRSTGGSGGSVTDVIAGLGYALYQREKYNNSDGAEGAFVVATNYSGGLDERFPRDFPMWCELYDELGKEGIINITAVSNSDNNVEATGDMPTLCDSDFIIAVTNTDIADRKISQAAYGNVSVDLGAPGEDAMSTLSRNRYQPFNGTSAATPQVAGVAALLYSLPCKNLIALAKEDPPAAALEVKRAILDGVDALTDLEGVTVTGGRLNAYKAFTELDKTSPTIDNCSVDVTIREDELTYTWDEILVTDDCGGYVIESSIENGSEFRIGTTEVEINVRDLLGNNTSCTFEVTREGSSENAVTYLEVSTVYYDDETYELFVEFETGSFEVHIVDLYNMLGQRIFNSLYTPISSGINTITVPLFGTSPVANKIPNLNFSSGSYFVVLSKAGGAIRDTRPFIIAH